jgi:transcriptional regulator with XRE-family HTH domain
MVSTWSFKTEGLMSKKSKASTRVDAQPDTRSQEPPERTNNVRKLRQARKWSQWQLAEISRLSQRTIQRVEAGGPLGVTAELALAAAFGIQVSDLYRCASGETEDLVLLRRVVSGNLLLDLIEATPRGSYEIEDLRDDEVILVREFIESMFVWVASYKDREPADRLTARHLFTSTIDELDSKALWVFVGPANATAAADQNQTWDRELKIGIFRASNPRIIQPGPLRQLGNDMCGIIVGASPRELDRRLVRPMTND